MAESYFFGQPLWPLLAGALHGKPLLFLPKNFKEMHAKNVRGRLRVFPCCASVLVPGRTGASWLLRQPAFNPLPAGPALEAQDVRPRWTLPERGGATCTGGVWTRYGGTWTARAFGLEGMKKSIADRL